MRTVWNTGARFLCDLGTPDNWGLTSESKKISNRLFAKRAKCAGGDNALVNRIMKKLRQLDGWLEVSNEPYGQPCLNASFNYREQAEKFAKWYAKQF